MALAARFLTIFATTSAPTSLSGSGTIGFRGAGALTTAIALAGSGTVRFGGGADFAPLGAALSGNGTIAFGGGASFTGIGALLSGAGTISFSGIGDLEFFAPVDPNPRRRIAVLSPDWVGTFPVMWTSAADVVTFDMKRLLAPATLTESAEQIDELLSFTLEVDDLYATDASPDSHALGVPTFEGSQVSQRFGNWQNIPVIHYRVTAIVTTTHGNTVPLVGMLPIRKPPN